MLNETNTPKEHLAATLLFRVDLPNGGYVYYPNLHDAFAASEDVFLRAGVYAPITPTASYVNHEQLRGESATPLRSPADGLASWVPRRASSQAPPSTSQTPSKD